MISVGIRELKSHLSQYIELVKNGENVLITEHNRVVAELKYPGKEDSNNNIQKILNKLANEGKLIPAKRKSTQINKIQKQNLNQKKLGDWWTLYQDSKEDKF
ncbi:type II toxin-antitoxin system Phd/YefM family antitoxin [Leptospira mtsangambouensis]|uniref:type II toxin-antitoxin system Phd/YefM family antitoxin n=1 Tax=Leptospira mtsangambouensis TaxID=2484912 RepID=UPI001EE9B603|nr:type II toxin-antitoxin system prevent-host-death family antitoxin [Leptospira mtsangambouensis]MCG6142811.1 type II toxin-antitoxin system prevent-host-death family antitoxin [Leptospira mtsangambouensis]